MTDRKRSSPTGASAYRARSRKRTAGTFREASRREKLKGLVIVGGVVAAVGIIIGVLYAVSGDNSRHRLAISPTQWTRELTTDFQPMEAGLLQYVETVESWKAGKGSATAVRASLEQNVPAFAKTLTALSHQVALPGASASLKDDQEAVSLYMASADEVYIALQLPPGALQHQVQLAAMRVRMLGDDVYDLAGHVLPDSATTTTVPHPDVVEVPAPDVPVWESVGLAPGPPLDDPVPSLPTQQYQVTRPQVLLGRWRAEVTSAHIPSASAERSAVIDPGLATARQVSMAFRAAAAKLGAWPDPDGDRPASTTLRLGLLVDAEAATAAESSSLVTAPATAHALELVAQALAAIGDQLWPSQLPAHHVGFPLSSLQQATPAALR